MTRLPRFAGRGFRREKESLLTCPLYYSDPPSSCSAGPVGEDLVRHPFPLRPDARLAS